MSAPTNLTPFAAAQVTNRVLASKGLEATVRPQMMYNYAKKGTIASNYVERSEGEKIYFDGPSFKEWLDKYVARIESGTSGTSVDYDELAKQFM